MEAKISTSRGKSVSNRLDSWKEIATYLKRGITTVQRWERAEGLPVHRHVHSSQSSVYAYSDQLDAWLSGRHPPGEIDRPLELVISGPSVAVLPMVNMSSEREDEYFSDGITEDLINVLAKIPGLRVPARTSVFQFKGKVEDVRRIGQRLRVDAILEGSVRRAGSRLRVTVRLVNVTDGCHIWSQTYDREISDIFAVQDEITSSIAAALRLQFEMSSGRERSLLQTHRRTWQQPRDPQCRLSHWTVRSLTRTLLWFIRFRLDWDWPEAEESFQKALHLNPDSASSCHYYSLYLAAMGRFEEAVRAVGVSESRTAVPVSEIRPTVPHSAAEDETCVSRCSSGLQPGGPGRVRKVGKDFHLWQRTIRRS